MVICMRLVQILSDNIYRILETWKGNYGFSYTVGIIIGFVMVVIGIITSTTNPTLKGIMDTFVDIPSIAVTIGGSMAGMLTSYTFKTFLGHLMIWHCYERSQA
ncbi:MAG: hypothetical protein ACLRMX_01260 [Lachnospira eligens]